MHYSDYNSRIVDQVNDNLQEESEAWQWDLPVQKREGYENKYVLLDIKNPEKILTDQPRDVLVAINVFDVMARTDLSIAAQGACNLLKDRGRILILADRPIECRPVFGQFNDPDEFVIPWKQENKLVGVKVVKTEVLEQSLQGKSYQPLFNELKALTPAQRHLFLLYSFYENDGLCEFLQDLIKQLDYRTYHIEDTYINEVTQAFEEAGFKKMESGYRKESVVLPRQYFLSAKNTISSDLRNGGRLECLTLGNIPVGHTQVETTFHVMVFEKRADLISK